MSITTLTSQEFGQDTDRARQAAADGPVYITDHDVPAHVLLTIEEYRRLAGGQKTLAEALSMPGDEDIDFDPPKMVIGLRPADFS
jgi:PHD/YefM family antitoxin component YafN of YafNO toxin-antitoxin module